MTAVLSVVLLASGCAQRVAVKEKRLAPGAVSNLGAPAVAEARIARDRIASGDGGEKAIEAYNAAVARVVNQAAKGFPPETGDGGDPSVVIGKGTGGSRIALSTSPEAPWTIEEIEAAKPTNFLRIRGLRERIVTGGIGAPVVVKLADVPSKWIVNSSGVYVPATALVDFDGEEGARLTFHDPLAELSVESLGTSRELAADFSAPLATSFARRERQHLNVPALFKPGKFSHLLGMHQIDAIYRDRIPVVLVHGLNSNPDTWRDVINELREDAVVRRRFEFWVFGYPSGQPIPYSAMELREALKTMARERNSRGASTEDVVLIGHSMGGLLSRIMTQSSGDKNWYRYFTEPIDQLDISETNRELLRKMAYFEPVPFVDRVVFISTPHGGSDLAGNPIGQLAAGLIQLPGRLLLLSTDFITGKRLKMLTPVGRELVEKGVTSIDMLQSESEFVRIVGDEPLNPRVTFHSILGSKDRVVRYESAHLEGAASEVTVPDQHDAHRHPESIAELSRILRLHAGE